MEVPFVSGPFSKRVLTPFLFQLAARVEGCCWGHAGICYPDAFRHIRDSIEASRRSGQPCVAVLAGYYYSKAPVQGMGAGSVVYMRPVTVANVAGVKLLLNNWQATIP